MKMDKNYNIEWDEQSPIGNQYYNWINEMYDYNHEYTESADEIVIVDEKYAEETEEDYYIGGK